LSIFKNIFGTKTEAEKPKPVAAPQHVDLATALSMLLLGQLDEAHQAFLRIHEAAPEDDLAAYFTAALTAYKGEVAEAAASLRALSAAIASRGGGISHAIVTDTLAVATPRMLAGVAEISVGFGVTLKEQGFLREGVVCLEIAAGLLPDNPHILHKFGDALHDLGHYDYAEKVLLEALKNAPNHWGALYTYAVLLQDLNRDEEALQYYDKAARFDPSHAKCLNNYGAALLRTNRVDEALVQCTAAAELDPESPLVQVNLGNIYFLKQQYEEARNCFGRAVALNDNLAAAHLGLGKAEEALGGDLELAKEHYRTAVRLSPALTELYPALKELAAS
jgi:Flp pilus assembly protein TadD